MTLPSTVGGVLHGGAVTASALGAPPLPDIVQAQQNRAAHRHHFQATNQLGVPTNKTAQRMFDELAYQHYKVGSLYSSKTTPANGKRRRVSSRSGWAPVDEKYL